ncbi:MAG: HNH endonuclease signature motif containing protein [Actinomycetota bacterium]
MKPLRPCLDCGRPTEGPRCKSCRPRSGTDPRGTRQQRGYSDQWLRSVKAAVSAQPWCSDCGAPWSRDNPLTGDHPVPMSEGGSPDQEPIVLCRRCNSAKGIAKGIARWKSR